MKLMKALKVMKATNYQHSRRRAIALLSGLALVTASLAHASVQEGGQRPVAPEGEPTTVIRPPMMDEAQQEMIRLFGKVERQLRRIDELLADAGAGNTRRLKEVEGSSIDELIRGSLDTGRTTIHDIDRILEIASQMAGQQGGQGSPQDGQPEEQPGGQQRGQQRGQREQTPEQPGGQQPDPSQPEEGQGEPRSPLDSQDPEATNEPADEPPPSATEDAGRPLHAGERWGDLPVHLQDIFRTEGDRHMPPRYRDWIDAYYRKLATRGDRR